MEYFYSWLMLHVWFRECSCVVECVGVYWKELCYQHTQPSGGHLKELCYQHTQPLVFAGFEGVKGAVLSAHAPCVFLLCNTASLETMYRCIHRQY